MSVLIRKRWLPGAPGLMLSEAGSGQLLIFLHGIGGNRTNWTDQIDVFARSYLAVAWDARGYGESDDYVGPASFDLFASDLLRVIDDYGVERAHICGLSLGGRIAQRFYAHHPERVASLILADSRPDTADSRSQSDRDAFFNSRARPLLEGKTPAEIASDVARSLVSASASAEAMARLRESISALRPESYLKAIRANLDDDYAGNISAIDVPTLLIVGEHDILTPPSLSQQMSQQIEGATLRIIDNAGHVSNIENPTAFNEALWSFLTLQSE